MWKYLTMRRYWRYALFNLPSLFRHWKWTLNYVLNLLLVYLRVKVRKKTNKTVYVLKQSSRYNYYKIGGSAIWGNDSAHGLKTHKRWPRLARYVLTLTCFWTNSFPKDLLCINGEVFLCILYEMKRRRRTMNLPSEKVGTGACSRMLLRRESIGRFSSLPKCVSIYRGRVTLRLLTVKRAPGETKER